MNDYARETYPLQLMREPTAVASRQLKPSALDESEHPVNLPVKSSVAMAKTNPHAVPGETVRYEPTPREKPHTGIDQSQVGVESGYREVLGTLRKAEGCSNGLLTMGRKMI